MKGNAPPWSERSRFGRGLADVLLGRYPRFVFGLGHGRRCVPVFHFHEVTPGYLEPFLRRLAGGGYEALSVERFLSVVEKREPVPPRGVFLTFDDAWTSVWTVAAPLLRRYGLRATVFAISGRTSPTPGLRSLLADDSGRADYGDRGSEPFARWDELRALEGEGVVEVEAHSHAHEQVPFFARAIGRWDAESLASVPILSRPVVREGRGVRAFDGRETGAPRFPGRSRFADVRAWMPGQGRFETGEEAREAIRDDLRHCRETLAAELGRPPRLLCFPWAVAGKVAETEAVEAGFRASFADRFPGFRAALPGNPPHRLMRLKHQWIRKLPA